MHSKDIVIWPCGSCCYLEELYEYSHKDDIYHVVPFGTHEWDLLVALEVE